MIALRWPRATHPAMSADRLVIRPATPADHGALYEIWAAAVDATNNFLSPDDREMFGRLVRDQYIPGVALTVAELDGEPVAFLGMSQANVDSLFVRADRHGQGIGRAMLDHAQAIAGAPLTVQVNEQNPQAVRFYERYGFERIGRTELDDMGRPYPTLQMAMPGARLAAVAGAG